LPKLPKLIFVRRLQLRAHIAAAPEAFRIELQALLVTPAPRILAILAILAMDK
jgi:hypothetical protein